ncbi:endonuclease [Dyadobacter arcticus]|uniref:Endonuclease/exonuclease/phosphatase family metal-dependent hydrolase n=1 Tax=Dyadobacter arcticus TaxID=1078754 RepID=A0ABX0US01_9BACT|nr:endonuclease [Dyadobacter arcticus]NIJ54510.1 endonuclease/exonuclease/phosphatase family metal-dependent hydrolase [Dyadobacter arcticus]
MSGQTNKNLIARHSIWLSLLFPFLISSTEFKRTSVETLPSLLNLAHLKSGNLSVISYNIAGLPQIISSATTDRAASTEEIGRKLNRFDIAHVQEDFNYNRFLYRASEHNFRTITKGKVLFGDGLNTLSKFPIHNVKRIKWNDCSGADCLTPKGFTYSQLEIAKGVFIDFYNVHANAYNHLAAAAARRKNIMQLSDFIQTNSIGNAVVVMGDLNGHYSYGHDNIGLLTTGHGLEDSWIVLKNNGAFPVSSLDMPASNILALSDSSETIDKILYRSSPAIQLKAVDYRLENNLFKNAEGLPLSDHHPVSARIMWTTHIQDQPRLTVSDN